MIFGHDILVTHARINSSICASHLCPRAPVAATPHVVVRCTRQRARRNVGDGRAAHDEDLVLEHEGRVVSPRGPCDCPGGRRDLIETANVRIERPRVRIECQNRESGIERRNRESKSTVDCGRIPYRLPLDPRCARLGRARTAPDVAVGTVWSARPRRRIRGIDNLRGRV